MRAHSKPTRPPRASRTPKETTGHLMKIISTLSNSQDNVDRDKEMEKLARSHTESDRKLAYLVKTHQDDLMLTMQAFSKVSVKVKSSKDKCHNMEDKLVKCKALLHCRRDELKRLWMEVFEHKRVLHMLKEIENLVEAPEKIESFLKEGKYLDATVLLVSSIELLEGSLDGTDALKELKVELYSKRQELHNILVKELLKLLYLFSSQGELKGMEGTSAEMIALSSKASHKFPESASEGGTTHRLWDSSTLDEENLLKMVKDLVECVALLNCIPETIEILKDTCHQELMNIVRRCAKHVADRSQNVLYSSQQSYLGFSQNKEQQVLLLDLLNLIFEQFKLVIRRHKSLLENLSVRKPKEGEEPIRTYEVADIWSKMQAVLEVFVGEYVDIHNSAATQPPAPSFTKMPSSIDISSFFMRKRNQKPKNFALFRFDCSSHAMSMKTYLQEQKEALREKGDMGTIDNESNAFICAPANKNITTIFEPVSKFITKMNEDLHLENTSDCPLYMFLNNCVKVFLGRVTMEVNHVIEDTAKSLKGWKTEFNPEDLKKVGAATFILHSALCVDSSMLELRELIDSLPEYSSHFIQIICSMLLNYRESCQAAYNSLIQPHAEDKRVISSSWARDKDISRLLRSLPNWTNLAQKGCPDFQESPEEIRLRNKPESEILITNLSGDTMISQHEILSDPDHLHNLALLHESMDWLRTRIMAFISSLPKQQFDCQALSNQQDTDDGDEAEQAPEGTAESLVKIAKDLGNLSDTCLLVLHLEVRVHCFYYLQPLTVQGSYATRVDNQEPDIEIIKLNSDLSKVDESLQSVLKPCNIKYVFEGLGELISTILINSTTKIKRINENGVKKMIRNIFALQQNLTGITMFREVALDRARQYFDLLNHTPEEILNSIVESGPQFQEQEYSAAFHLLHRSHPGSDMGELKNYLERLHQILNEVAVSV